MRPSIIDRGQSRNWESLKATARLRSTLQKVQQKRLIINPEESKDISLRQLYLSFRLGGQFIIRPAVENLSEIVTQQKGSH